MRFASIIGAALLVVLASPAVATGVPETQAPAPVTVPASAADLARLMSPRELLIETELREYDRNFVPTMRANPEMTPLEQEYPGLFEAMHRASRPLVAKAMGKAVDRLHVKVTGLFESNFTAGEISDLIAFYRSPTGQNVLTQMAASVDASKIYQKAVGQGEPQVTSEDIAAQSKAAAAKASKSFSAHDQGELVALMGKPAFWKLREIQPQMRAMMAETLNASDPEADAEMEAVMMEAAKQVMTGKATK